MAMAAGRASLKGRLFEFFLASSRIARGSVFFCFSIVKDFSMCSRYFLASSLLLVIVSSVASTKDSPTGIKQLSLENKNRIKSKHLEMWDIVQSIIERTTTLDRIAKVHNHHTYDMQLGNNSNMFRKHGPYHRANRLNSSNYKRQNYKMNIEMSTMLLNEARKLSELEKVCQDII